MIINKPETINIAISIYHSRHNLCNSTELSWLLLANFLNQVKLENNDVQDNRDQLLHYKHLHLSLESTFYKMTSKTHPEIDNRSCDVRSQEGKK